MSQVPSVPAHPTHEQTPAFGWLNLKLSPAGAAPWILSHTMQEGSSHASDADGAEDLVCSLDHGLAWEAADGAAMNHHPGAPLCRASPAFHKCDLQFSSLVHDPAFAFINTKDRLLLHTFTTHHIYHIKLCRHLRPWAGNDMPLQWLSKIYQLASFNPLSVTKQWIKCTLKKQGIFFLSAWPYCQKDNGWQSLFLSPVIPLYIPMQASVSFNIRPASIYLPVVIPLNARST